MPEIKTYTIPHKPRSKNYPVGSYGDPGSNSQTESSGQKVVSSPVSVQSRSVQIDPPDYNSIINTLNQLQTDLVQLKNEVGLLKLELKSG